MTKKIRICIDAGHYGNYNPSPVVTGYYEAQMAWKLHLLQKMHLEAYGIEVITTRNNEVVDRDLYGRGTTAAGCDLFISDHSNACGTECVDRAEVIGTLNGKAETLGRKLMFVIAEVMGTNDVPKYFTRKQSNGQDWYGVLRGAADAGVGGLILEHSFHTNTRTAQWLMVDTNLDKLASAEAECIAFHFGMKKVNETVSSDTSSGTAALSAAENIPELSVTGIWGMATTIATQKFFDLPVDGIISGQPMSNKKHLYSADAADWEFIGSGNCTGSNTIRRLQHFIGIEEDGYFGYNSVVAFQRWLRNKGVYTGAIDGSMGSQTVTAWQTYLNNH